MRSTELAFRFVLPLAASGALLFLARFQNPVAAAQSAFLALVIGGVLAALAVLARSGTQLATIAFMATALTALTGQGPHRSAAVFLFLTAALGWVSLSRKKSFSTVESGTAELSSAFLPELAALAISLQLLLRTDLLLPPIFDPRTLVSLFALPVAVAGSTFLLSRAWGLRAAWLAAGVAATLGPGWNVTSTLALTSLAAGTTLADRQLHTAWRVAALSMLFIPVYWDPLLGTLIALTGAAPALRGRTGWIVPLFGGMVVAHVLDQAPVYPGPILDLWLLTALTLPSLLLAPRKLRSFLVRGLLLALAAAVVAPRPEALVAGLALAALTLGEVRRVSSFQDAWSAGLLFAVTILAAPPWRRAFPLEALLELFHLDIRSTVLIVLLATTLLSMAPRRFVRHAGVLAALLILLLGLRAVPVTEEVPIAWQRVVLSPAQTTWRATLPVKLEPKEISTIFLESHLIGGEDIPDGTWIAILRIKTEDGTLVRRRVLAGEHTAAVSDEGTTVPVRLSQLSADSTDFVPRFSGIFDLDAPAHIERVTLRLNPDLPEETRWMVYRMEMRR